MNRRLTHMGSVVMTAWVLIFSVVAPLGLVVCVGDNGHMALEREHERGHISPSSETPTGISHVDCGDCSDTPVILFYGRVRTDPRPQAPENFVFSQLGAFSMTPGYELDRFRDKIIIPDQYRINYSAELYSVILIC